MKLSTDTASFFVSAKKAKQGERELSASGLKVDVEPKYSQKFAGDQLEPVVGATCELQLKDQLNFKKKTKEKDKVKKKKNWKSYRN